VHQLSIDCKKAYDYVRRDVLYNILIEFCIPMKLVMLIKMCLKRIAESGWAICLTCFQLEMVCNKEMLYRHCFSTLLQSIPLGAFRKPGEPEIKWYPSAPGLR
jgi:TRAP-type C4-dicarboxylate transport system permease large subunit